MARLSGALVVVAACATGGTGASTEAPRSAPDLAQAGDAGSTPECSRGRLFVEPMDARWRDTSQMPPGALRDAIAKGARGEGWSVTDVREEADVVVVPHRRKAGLKDVLELTLLRGGSVVARETTGVSEYYMHNVAAEVTERLLQRAGPKLRPKGC